MDVPGIVEEALDGEEVAADVDLGGDDALFVTPTRTLIYRSEGLLSDESVESYSHEAESLSLSQGRRKTRITLDHPIDGVEEFTLPSSAADEAIPSILAGILGMNDVIGTDESVVDTYLFSELTVVVADDRLVKHVGETVWDLDFEEYPFADVTGVYAEQGSVATQLVIEIDGRAERIKTPSDRAREVRETLEGAIRRYHGLGPDEDLNEALAPDSDAAEESESDESASTSGMDFGEGVDPLSAGDTTQGSRNPDPKDLETEVATSDPAESSAETGGTDEAAGAGDADDHTGGQPSKASETSSTDAGEAQTTAEPSADREHDDSGTSSEEPSANAATSNRSDVSTPSDAASNEPAPDDLKETDVEQATDPSEELAEEVAELRVAVQKQNKLLTRQHKTIQKLVEELRRGR